MGDLHAGIPQVYDRSLSEMSVMHVRWNQKKKKKKMTQLEFVRVARQRHVGLDRGASVIGNCDWEIGREMLFIFN